MVFDQSRLWPVKSRSRVVTVVTKPVTGSFGQVLLSAWAAVTGYSPVSWPKGQKTGLSRTLKHYLKIPYQSRKLAPKWEGPFKIKEVLGLVTYWLTLPKQWRIHDVFHAFRGWSQRRRSQFITNIHAQCDAVKMPSLPSQTLTNNINSWGPVLTQATPLPQVKLPFII